MRLGQLRLPLQAAALSPGYRPVLTTFNLPVRPAVPAQPQAADGLVEGRRYASVKSQGAYRIPNKKTIAKKLGAKKSGGQYVIPGNIIFKQRGTTWHPGENAFRGRDHTIHAGVAGYVKYYRDPELHPKRQFIGVAFNKEDVLPYPKNEPRRRKLGMVAVTRKVPQISTSNINASGLPKTVVRRGGLYDIEELEQRVWSLDKKRELVEAQRAAELANKLRKAPAAAAAAAKEAAEAGEVYPTTITNADESQSQAGARPSQKLARGQKRRAVTPLELVQKKWLERRRTRTLHLDPRKYSYSESNAAIGRLASRTMYRAPWELGGRKSRFRAKRRRKEEKIKQIKANKELVKQEKEKEKIAEEKRRAAKLAKQRAKGAGKAKQAKEAGEAGEKATGEKATAEKAANVKEAGELGEKVAGEKAAEEKASGEKAADVKEAGEVREVATGEKATNVKEAGEVGEKVAGEKATEQKAVDVKEAGEVRDKAANVKAAGEAGEKAAEQKAADVKPLGEVGKTATGDKATEEKATEAKAVQEVREAGEVKEKATGDKPVVDVKPKAEKSETAAPAKESNSAPAAPEKAAAKEGEKPADS